MARLRISPRSCPVMWFGLSALRQREVVNVAKQQSREDTTGGVETKRNAQSHRCFSLASFMNENPPPYPGPGPAGAYPAYPQQYGPGPNAAYPGYPPPPGGQPVYQGYPQYGWQNAPPQPGMVYADAPKNTVYVVEDRRRDDTGDTCLTACWTALCCCCLWDMLT
ncbi:cysteine-rich and transmembrane domain-containing protein 1-like isoform X2 [Chiloscyllium plagiosum]|uniref:cysteine-rich and transmembrane domain-containing protein 1-like isoform X2 n=1 Tax=Chiloscyllium plagiosum TaxID=36176 RepID=UPI001CB7C828|nr:cysteine-rich and transmembrane domain-containing protein 1-like isoform X2 [Chiloscyllium plagiosum]